MNIQDNKTMQISIFSLLLFCMSMSAPAALADNITIPDSEQRKGMSYEEYSSFREKMRKQMENKKADAPRSNAANDETNPVDQSEKSQRDSAYGQGYHSRPSSVDRPDTGAANRPERPQVERFNRGDMGRR